MTFAARPTTTASETTYDQFPSFWAVKDLVASIFRTLPTNGRCSVYALNPVWLRSQQRFLATMPA